ncbi:MAG: hypothetical protein LLF96_05440 [Eubacteriales bacterium]|nr:hypothetical protein [Eubacteriales bacterium]
MFYALQKIVKSGPRTVEALEKAKLLNHAVYYGEVPDFSGCMERKAYREKWHLGALAALNGPAVVFLDLIMG